jgi:hypothetical protein
MHDSIRLNIYSVGNFLPPLVYCGIPSIKIITAINNYYTTVVCWVNR